MRLEREIELIGKRSEKIVTVLEAEQYDPGFPPSPLAEFLEWAERISGKIPDQFRATATIEFESVSSYYDSHYGKVTIQYRRLETDDEMRERENRLLAQKQSQKDAERRQYESLKAKFGDA